MKPVTDPSILAQLNGGNQQQPYAPQGLRPVEDPAILAQLNGGDQQQPQQQGEAPQEEGFLKKAYSPYLHAIAGLATSGRNTQNNLQDSMSGGGINDVMGEIKGLKDVRRPESDRSYDYYKAMGLNENLADKIGVGALDFAPYMIGGQGLAKGAGKLIAESPKLAEKAAAFSTKNPYSSAFLKNMAENVPSGAAFTAANKGDQGESLAASTAASALPVALQPLVKYGAKQYAQSAIPKFTEKATEKLRELLPAGVYSKKLEDKFLNAVGVNKANWKGLEKTAGEIDQSLVSPIRAHGKLIDAKGKNKIQNEVENTNRMGEKIDPQFTGRDSSNLPANIKPEIVGYDAGGAPIMKQPPHDFSVAQRDIPITKKISENVPRGTKVSSGEYDASGAPIMKEGIDFKNSPYNSYIENFKNKVGAMEPAKRQEYSQALKLADKALEMSPRSFEGSVALRKNINQDMKEYLNSQSGSITPQNSKSKQFLSGLKENLKNDTIDANKDKVGAEALTGFKNQWEAANKSHQDVLKFNKSPQKMTGIEEEGRTVRNAFKASLPKNMGGEGIPLDPAIIGKYAPTLSPSGAKGIEGIKQLETLLGDKKLARDAIKAHIFQKQLTNGANTIDAPAKYAQLSQAQKKRLFGNSEEGKYLEAINKTRLAFNREPAKTAEGMGMNRHLSGMGAPALLGFGGSYYGGDSWDKSLMHGIEAGLAAKVAGSVAGRFATPKSVERAIAMKSMQPTSGRYLNLAAQNLINEQKKDRS